MKRQLKVISFTLFVVIITSVTIYLVFGQHPPPADPHSERIAFRMTSSFPGASGIFIYSDIYAMNIDKPGLTRITRNNDILEMPAWSPNGDKIAYTRADGLYIAAVNNSAQTELLWESLGHSTTVDPTWSPDGSKIAFRDGKIYIIDINTKQTTNLLTGSNSGSQPAWSPDGNKIAFRLHSTSGNGLSNSSIAKINADGSSLVQITPENGSNSPEWSPDGKQIVFERDNNLYVMDTDGTNIVALTQDGQSLSPTWSSDGTRIAFVSLANQKCTDFISDFFEFCSTELRVMDADGSNVRVIRGEYNENVAYPAWDPSGS